jgi:hypothetical protein
VNPSEMAIRPTLTRIPKAMSIPLKMKAGVYNGMLSEGLEPLTASCPTGNCTWPVTPSLAVCGECSHSAYTTSCNETGCNYTMPSGTVFVFTSASAYSQGLGFQVTRSGGAKYNGSNQDRLYLAIFGKFGEPSFQCYRTILPSALAYSAFRC